MKTRYKEILIIANLLLLLVAFNFSILKKEKLLDEGQLVLLELAPVDPRSLMQGDYMELRYSITSRVHPELISKKGFCIVQLQTDGTAKAIRFQDHSTSLGSNEYPIAYTRSKYTIHIGAESFFFEEGNAEKYSKAKYGGLKIDKEGNSLLTGLYDDQMKKIQ